MELVRMTFQRDSEITNNLLAKDRRRYGSGKKVAETFRGKGGNS
jgi:hypothetical protein